MKILKSANCIWKVRETRGGMEFLLEKGLPTLPASTARITGDPEVDARNRALHTARSKAHSYELASAVLMDVTPAELAAMVAAEGAAAVAA